MGSVWIAEHLVLGREVALKLMSRQCAAMPNARTRFLREAKITALLESPHVVRVLDCRLDESDEPYLVLELLHGENLEQRISRKGPLSIWDVEKIVEQAASALGDAHAHAIIHRDVKPENVFLVDGPTTFVKLLDFGVAKPKAIEDCLDVDLLPAGTPQYMSPEHMFEPETTDERSDLFALGAVTYFALTGRSPFAAESLEALYFAIEGAKFARPSVLRPELPAAVDAWFERALARDRDKRFQSASEMSEALHDAVLAGSSSARILVPVGPTLADDDGAPSTRSVPGLPRRRVGRSFAVFAAAAAAVGIWFWHSGGDVTPAVASTTETQAAVVERPVPVAAPSPAAASLPTKVPAQATMRTSKRAPAKVLSPAKPAVTAKPAAPAPLPLPPPVVTEPAPEPEPPEDALDPEHISTSIRELIGNEPKVDVDP